MGGRWREGERERVSEWLGGLVGGREGGRGRASERARKREGGSGGRELETATISTFVF